MTCVSSGLHEMWRPETADVCIFRSPQNVETGDRRPLYIIPHIFHYFLLLNIVG